jgi:predicted regulator of Ras-like GTPase activity (Roadblock/LC7/MglB family)/Flp pilus assembly protein TadD
MALVGSIEEIGITDILQLLALSQKTGILTVRNDRNEDLGILYFKDGRVAYGVLINESLENRLLREGRVDQREVDRLRNSLKEGESIEDAILRSRILDVLDMRKYLRKSAEETVYALCGQRTGIFQFERSELPLNQDLALNLKTDSLIIESSRRMDEFSRIQERLPTLDTVLEVSPKHKQWREKNIESAESALLSLVEQGKNVKEIYDSMGQEFSTVETLYNLLESRVIHIASPSTGKEHLKKGRKHLIKGEMGEALEMLEHAVEEGVEQKEAHLFLGDLLLRQGDFRKAQQEYETAMQQDPHDPVILSRLGYTHAKLGNISQAITYWENFLILPYDTTIKEKTEKVLKEARIFQKYLEDSLLVPAAEPQKKKDLKDLLREINSEKGILGSMVIDDTGLIIEKDIPESEKVEEAATFSASFLLLAKRSLHLLKLGDLERAVLDKGDWRIHLVKIDPHILVVLTGSETHLELQMATFQRLYEHNKMRR